MGSVTPITVLYDEGCGVCIRLARWLAHHGAGVSVVEIGSPAGGTLLRDLSSTERYAAFHAVDPVGRRQSGGAALPLVLETLPGGTVPASLAAKFPRLADVAYRAVARQRSRLSRLL